MTPHPDSIPFSALAEDIKRVVTARNSLPRAICFDYFDTLVFRIVAPETTKVIAAHQLSLLLGALSADVVYGIRGQLEAKLCGERRAAGQDPEFSLPVLASRLYHLLIAMCDNSPVLATEEVFVQRFSEIELAVEKAVQRPYPELLELLEWLNRHDVKTCLVSDFYLPQESFGLLLIHHGLAKYFPHVFVSADYGLTKGSGRLYGEVCNKLDCRPEELWMIGDNLHADKLMAEQAGLRATLVDVTAQLRNYELWQGQVRSVQERGQSLERRFAEIVSSAGQLYFPEMSSTLWYFIQQLFDHLYSRQVTDVFFCSKEGEFLQRLFLAYQEKMFGATLVFSHYLVVSRKATFICSLQPLAQETFSRLFEQYRDLTLTEFVLSLNFSQKELAALRAQLAVDWTGRLANLQHHEHFWALLSLPLFQEMYEQHRIEQRNNFLHYLDAFGVDYPRDGLHLVDVGWKGSIQNNIYFALEEEVAVYGYYVGLLTPSRLTEKNFKTGVLFSDYPQLSPYVHVYNNNRSLFEMILGASHGSADGYFNEVQLLEYQKERGSVVFEQIPRYSPSAVTVLDLPEERRLFTEQIQPLQEAYFAMFTKMTAAAIEHYCSPPQRVWFAERHARMLFRPKPAEVAFFSQLYHLENFGLFEFTAFAAEERIPLLRRLRNLIALSKNPGGFLETGVWPPIILRRLGLSWLQPIDGRKRFRRIFREQG